MTKCRSQVIQLLIVFVMVWGLTAPSVLDASQKKVNMEVFEKSEEEISFFALPGESNVTGPVDQLIKGDIYFLINGRNVRGFSLHKINRQLLTKKDINPPVPGVSNRKQGCTVYFLFDSVPAAGQANMFASIASHIAGSAATKNNLYFLSVGPAGELSQLGTVSPGSRVLPRMLQSKKPGQKAKPVELERRYLKAFNALNHRLRKRKGTKIVYFFPGPNRDYMFSGRFYNLAADAMGESGALWVTVEPGDHPGAAAPGLYKKITEAAKSIYITGTGNQIKQRIDELNQSFYKITFTYLKEYGGSGSYIILASGKEKIRLASQQYFRREKASKGNNERPIPVDNKKPERLTMSNEKSSLRAFSKAADRVSPLTSSKPVFPLLEGTRADTLEKLKRFRLNLGASDTPANHILQEAVRLLRQNRVKQALGIMSRLPHRIRKDKKIAPIIKTLSQMNYQASQLQRQAAKMSKKSLARNSIQNKTKKEMTKFLEKGNIKKALAALQKLLDSQEEQMREVEKIIAKIPALLQITDVPGFRPDERGNLFSLRQRAQWCRKMIGVLKKNPAKMTRRVFFEAGWTKKILEPAEKFLDGISPAEPGKTSGIQWFSQKLRQLLDAYPGPVADFVIANSRTFPREFRRVIFKKKLQMLGAPDELLRQSSFLNVAIQSQSLSRNSKGYWEAVFGGHITGPRGKGKAITLIYIPPGEFTMGLKWETGGAEDESPQHPVHLDGYWIGKYEVTFQQYDLYCEETGKKQLISDLGRGRGKRPVFGVTWRMSQDFCQWLANRNGLPFRLPTEAEWEKAARGSKKIKYPWGDNDPNGKHANFADVRFLKKYQELNPPENEKQKKLNRQWIAEAVDDRYIFTAPVGSYPSGASPYGAMDMAGNVWEWVLDWYDDDYYHTSPKNNPARLSLGTYKVARGGGWDCHPWLIRSTGRAGCEPAKGNDTLGFRVAVGFH